MMFFCFADPHFKKANHRRRIINTALLSDYAYVLKPGGKIYVVTDVEDLHKWQVTKLTEHPMFHKLTDQEMQGDPCISYMREGTDEARKVKRNGGTIWHAVFRKRDVNTEMEII
jgi:tRNA (guanine-N7-)-methyltransferase